MSEEIFKIFLQILIDGPHWKKGKPEETAILLLPGTHQEYRITEGIKLWPKEGKYFWVAGTRGDPEYRREDIIAAAGKDSPDIVCQGFARFTPDQMAWCVLMLKENPHIKNVIVTTAAYHLPRCVLTLLEVLRKEGMQITITPIPLLSPTGDSFNGSEDFALEIEKIEEYQKKGDVASLEVWKKYLNFQSLALE